MKHTSKLILAIGLAAGASSAFSAPATLGALFSFSGTGASAGISGSIYDKDIHSGVFRDVNAAPSLLSGAPVLSDSYVLQGGDPFGGDTGDAFEVTQTDGHATVSSFFDVFTHYDFGNPACADQVGTCIAAAPDTGVLTFVNNSVSEWTGVLTLSGLAFGGIYGPPQFFSNSGSVDLLPGESAKILLNNESSNYGGYNHPDVPGVLPEPASLALVGIALFGIAANGARRRKTGIAS